MTFARSPHRGRAAGYLVEHRPVADPEALLAFSYGLGHLLVGAEQDEGRVLQPFGRDAAPNSVASSSAAACRSSVTTTAWISALSSIWSKRSPAASRTTAIRSSSPSVSKWVSHDRAWRPGCG